MKTKTVLLGALLLSVLLWAAVLTEKLVAQGDRTSSAALADTPGFLGLASRYPGDVGIGTDSSVVFTEDFESTTVEDLSQRWTEVNNKDDMVLYIVKDTTAPSAGKYCLRMTAIKGINGGGYLWNLLDKGYEQIYARFYCKFAPDAPYSGHFVAMGGIVNSPGYFVGFAGRRPAGNEQFLTNIDLVNREATNPPGGWSFYSYWCEMHSWQTPEGIPDGRPNPYYGNLFGPVEPLQAKRGEWQCVEIMIKLNDPELRNGEQAFWIDGKLIERYGPGTVEGTWVNDSFHRSGEFNTNPQPFEGFRWRTTDELKINVFWLQYYMTGIFANDFNPHDPDIPYNDNIAEVYFDNIVLATKYIGPVATAAEKPSCDYDGDGRGGLFDVIKLIQLCMADPPDARADYNGDGYCNVSDALSLLLDIVHGKC